MTTPTKKFYVVTKYVWARSAHEALIQERTQKPDEVWVDPAWKNAHVSKPQLSVEEE